MLILLTRAQADAARTRDLLEALGHQVLVSPVLEMKATGAAWPGGAVDAVIATSRQPFTIMRDDWGPTAEARRLMPLRIVGHSCVSAVRRCGFLGATRVYPDAASLATDLRANDARRHYVYLAGRYRKSHVSDAAEESDTNIDVVECYGAEASKSLTERTCVALKNDTVDVVMHFSKRSAGLFIELAREYISKLRPVHICLSEDVAAPLLNEGWYTLVADNPSNPAMLAKLGGLRIT